MRALRISAIATSLLVALCGVVIFALTRDSPARAALGEPRQATHNEARIEYFIAGPARGQSVVLLPSYARSVSAAPRVSA